ncbi:NPP1 family protein [Paenibacillus tarimensis]
MKKGIAVLLVSFFASVVFLTTIHAAVIGHDKVIGFEEVPPASVTEIAAKHFQPYLKVINGCVPFPAVDAQGNTNGGLKPTGAPEGGCSKNTGQIYARSAWYNGVWAIMYAWYFPKDEASPGMGHRHDWEGIVVWVNNPAVNNPEVLSIAYSEHGNFINEAPSRNNMSGSHPLVAYRSVWPLNHSLHLTNEAGGTQPLINWEQLTPAAREALNTTDFGKANVPFNDNNFWNNLGKAWFKQPKQMPVCRAVRPAGGCIVYKTFEKNLAK